MKRMILFFLINSIINPVFAFDEELSLQAVFLGRFAQFIEWPEQQKEHFIITLIDENPFANMLDNLYKDKTIHGKSIKIFYVTKIDEINKTDILFITLDDPKEVKKAINFAQQNAILTISKRRGFAQRGGIIQLNFVMQKTHLKINYDASIKSKIKISAPLLAIAKEVIMVGE